MKYYLRVEAVNLDAVLSDTSQLSVIRGSSLLLRQATLELSSQIENHSLEPISTGASTGLYHFDATDEETAELSKEVTTFLKNKYPDFTFVIDILPDSGSFQKDQSTLINKNRYQQLQQLSLALPSTNQSIDYSVVACELDGVRPTSKETFKDKHISPSVARRLKYGRNERNNFYANELGDPDLKKLKFTNDLASLAQSSAHGTLNNKVAVLYFDGNKFGKIQHQFCKDRTTRKQFDDDIANKQKGFLKSLLEYIKSNSAYLTKDNKIRLEVLMWGGDEILLVVPAWCGIDVLQRFYKATDGWKFPANSNNASSMTYAGGIVFSQANTPMYRLRELAKNLADSIKQTNSDTNLFDYLILESMDFPAEPLSNLRNQQYSEKAKGRTLLQPLDSEKLLSVHSLINKDLLPKSQIISLAQSAIQKSTDDFEDKKKRLIDLLKDSDVRIEIENDLDRLFKSQGSNDVIDMFARFTAGTLSDTVSIWPWIHLAELWDYLFINNKEENTNA